MMTRTTLADVEIGSCGRVLLCGTPGHRLVRANEATLSPETKIVVVLVL